MPTYTVKVLTGYSLLNLLDIIYIRLVGTDGESYWTWFRGKESSFTVTCPKSLGELESVDVQKQWRPWLFRHHWFVKKVEVTSPDAKVFKFPIYHWIKRTKMYSFYEGKGRKSWEPSPFVRYTRQMELNRREEKYRWKVYKEGLPDCIDANKVSDLPSEVQFSTVKNKDFFSTAIIEQVTIIPKILRDKILGKKEWQSFGALERALSDRNTSPVSKYVEQNWKDDAFFGYQFLNGIHPMMIQRCKSLPTKLPVTDDMVTLEGNGKLSDEIKNGNIFLCDYEPLDGVETGKINNVQQYLTAPVVLLHKTPADELKPVVIQLKQIPAADNPIYFNTDSEYNWLLAKIYVRSADFNEHQLNAHLLRTHLLAEVFTVALLRNVPKVHPLYKLLIPNTRFTLHINLLARELLISEGGVFTKFAAASVKGMTTLMRRSLLAETYKSLCIKDNIKERGLESVPNYYYRDDGFKLWDAIEKFVNGVLSYYYKEDEEVKRDTELQNYIKDVFVHGFLSRETSGIPQRFETVAELVKFATMVIFTGSAQHAAVNNGQSQYGSWMPNTPTSLQRPPPATKEVITEKTVLQTLPDRNTTQNAVSVVKLLSTQSSDFVALGQFPHENFTEEVPIRLIEEFRDDLKKLDEEIDSRNRKIKLPYVFLKPNQMENSVSI